MRLAGSKSPTEERRGPRERPRCCPGRGWVVSFISVTMHPGVVEVVRGAIADIDQVHNVATAAAPDPVTAFAAANELAAHMQVLAASDDKLKEQLSGRVWEARKMSLAGMADQVGISKRRAEQQAKDAKADNHISSPRPVVRALGVPNGSLRIRSADGAPKVCSRARSRLLAAG
jgi:hypothetical protein